MSTIVKICGLKSAEAVAAALAAGADMIGFVFFPKSPRHVSLDEAAALAAAARGRAEIVALTVDADDAAIAAIRDGLRPDWFQLHGKETPERVAAVRQLAGTQVMKAIGVAEAADVARNVSYAPVVDRLLFDAKPPRDAALPGGNGVTFDWDILAAGAGGKPFMLSGGLDPDNVGAAVRRLADVPGFLGVDVSSGVERGPGEKDAGRIAAFVAAARL
ncbi:phosphoribosylanthranilate isomerase [Chelatococcus composti]|uniref:N-(5'-phosphoribosyl)anthranilate isomerase n=1 Tax=Chelatococcus composti TaxID=1743235 RepID=A0A841KBY3_9HYPH|nr:phosphoribosylanthranilate isomerase [Chelatococcus composti]MBB6167516.1 phosphoribosylanthranilate isomerase [Chelatococcus composti]MBS7735720.1 phosphoribosylanthranilate isomerase [Chelatococcus composti]GGG32484.1 N-(5'-phosphoribosyl)anthranilate isomerase [Chelatococcus composti]